MDADMEVNGAHKSVRNGNGKRHEFVPCISKKLYDVPPQSDFILLQMLYNIIHTSFIILSKFRFGQVIISVLDYYMIKIENTLDFCLPDNCEFASQRVIDKHKRSLPIQDRPMSWLFFIPVLIFLRILRFTMSFYCIIAGMGEVTAQQMQSKVIGFRRYYRSIRHYAVNRWTEDDKKLIDNRKGWPFWRLYYQIYEMIFMTKQIVEIHQLNDDREKVKLNGHGKGSLNVTIPDSDDDDNLNTNDLLDLDYEPDEAKKKLDETVESADSSEEDEEILLQEIYEDESVNKLGESSKSHHLNSSGGSSTDEQTDANDKSNDEYFLTSSQLNDLENEIMMKILNYFKENYNFPPAEDFSDEVFYSPIGSPLENGTILHKTEVIESLTTEKETQNMGTEVCTTITEVHTKETIETVTESHAVESENQQNCETSNEDQTE